MGHEFLRVGKKNRAGCGQSRSAREGCGARVVLRLNRHKRALRTVHLFIWLAKFPMGSEVSVPSIV